MDESVLENTLAVLLDFGKGLPDRNRVFLVVVLVVIKMVMNFLNKPLQLVMLEKKLDLKFGSLS